MNQDPSKQTDSTPLSQQETDALNKHGVFFKKRILHALQEIQGIGIVSEELGVSFGGTRVIDILARDARDKPEVLFTFECKRAYAAEKRWIFFRDLDQRYRVLRMQSGLMGHSSVFARTEPPHPPVCSEGYEFRKSDGKADQDPVFKAAAQLVAGYLGLIAWRHREFHRVAVASDIVEHYVPVLITTAELVLVQSDLRATCIKTGNMPAGPQGASVDCLILKHPFPSPEGIDRDFRDDPNPAPSSKDWGQLHKESIYVVRAAALANFLAIDHRDYLRSAKSDD